jgi:hypothetical protein
MSWDRGVRGNCGAVRRRALNVGRSPSGRVWSTPPSVVPSGPAATSDLSRSFHMSRSSWLGAVPIKPGWMRPVQAPKDLCEVRICVHTSYYLCPLPRPIMSACQPACYSACAYLCLRMCLFYYGEKQGIQRYTSIAIAQLSAPPHPSSPPAKRTPGMWRDWA